jgi:hypothetical protein
MRLNIISEKTGLDPASLGMEEQPVEAPEGLQTAPLGQAQEPEAPPEEQSQDEMGAAMGPKDDTGKAESAIDAVEKLRSAAAGLDAASFSMKTDYSDFSLAERIEQVKQELIYIIGKAKEHVEYSAARNPQAKQKVSQWLNQ